MIEFWSLEYPQTLSLGPGREGYYQGQSDPEMQPVFDDWPSLAWCRKMRQKEIINF